MTAIQGSTETRHLGWLNLTGKHAQTSRVLIGCRLMKAIALILFLVVLTAVAKADPFVVIVRHAEKSLDGGNDPNLTPGGLARAQVLAEMLKDSGITAIFTSEFKRTQQTAAATAQALRVTPTIVPGKDSAAMVAKLREIKGNGLVVGHGNTVPELVKAIGIDTQINIQENDYNEIFLVSLGQKPQLFRLHYPNDVGKSDEEKHEAGRAK
jgi:phosphohistidine phosphatase SixA